MDEADSKALRREILDDIGQLLREELAADAWGRVLVEVVRTPEGEPVVAGVDVEEVLDDARVDAVFGREEARALMPVLAKAIEALCAVDGLDLEEIRGGTFVRLGDTDIGWLPALVHAPSAALDADRDRLAARLKEKNAALEARFGFPANGRPEIDLGTERLRFVVGSQTVASARVTLLGTFSPRVRTWGWGGAHPNAPQAVRRAASAVVDAIPDRAMWELSTPVFATDEATAWLLAALVVDRAGGDGALCVREADGLVFFLLRDFEASQRS